MGSEPFLSIGIHIDLMQYSCSMKISCVETTRAQAVAMHNEKLKETEFHGETHCSRTPIIIIL